MKIYTPDEHYKNDNVVRKGITANWLVILINIKIHLRSTLVYKTRYRLLQNSLMKTSLSQKYDRLVILKHDRFQQYVGPQLISLQPNDEGGPQFPHVKLKGLSNSTRIKKCKRIRLAALTFALAEGIIFQDMEKKRHTQLMKTILPVKLP